MVTIGTYMEQAHGEQSMVACHRDPYETNAYIIIGFLNSYLSCCTFCYSLGK